MNSEGGIRRLSDSEQLKAGEKLLPKRFDKDAAEMLDEGRVPSVGLAKLALKVRGASASKKRKRKIAQASSRRNRR